jgi:23S rRNA pseudouridine1911/1915/1917 synthase
MPDSSKAPPGFLVPRSGVRLDKFLAEATQSGRRSTRALIRDGAVRVDGHHCAASTKLVAGQTVSVESMDTAAGDSVDAPPLLPTLDVLAEGRDWLAIDKPAGVHSVAGRSGNSMADLLIQEFPQAGSVSTSSRDGGLVNRLDRDTSGVLLAARDRESWLELRSAFAEHAVTKHYLALVAGTVKAPLTVDQPLARRRSRVRRPHRGEKSYPALTTFHPLETSEHWSLVLATMRTGVTHQIRAHAALSGFPILGDLKYGDQVGPPGGRSGHLLHALRLVVPDTVDVTAPIAADFRRALTTLRGD